MSSLSATALFALLLALNTLGGLGSIGFVGPALRIAVEVGGPVTGVYSSGAVEWLIQLWGFGLTQMSTCTVRFGGCAALVGCAALGVVFAGRLPGPHKGREPGGAQDYSAASAARRAPLLADDDAP